nr:helix-turn-helix domain-containing protein [Polymorphobacter sp.]
MASDLVKSAARAIEILEVFAIERRRLTLAQVGGLLDYPKSSLGVLLKSLLAQGYLSFLPTDLSYFPTLKVSALGDWIPSALFGNELLPMLQDLRDATGETVTVTTPAGQNMRCLRVLLGTHRIALQLDEGTTFPIIGSAVGAGYLAALNKAEYDAFMARARSPKSGFDPKDVDQTDRMVKTARKRGYAAAYDSVTDDAGAVAIALPTSIFGDPIVIAVAGLSNRIQRSESQIARLLTKHMGITAPA